MPKHKLNWKQDQKRAAGGRWMKTYKGNTFYFAEVEGKSDREGYRRACEAFEQWRAEIDLGQKDKPHKEEYQKQISLRKAALQFAELEPQKVSQTEIEFLRNDLAKLEKDFLKPAPPQPEEMHRYRRWMWEERASFVEKHNRWNGNTKKEEVKSLRWHGEKYVEHKRNLAEIGQIATSTYKSIRERMNKLIEHSGDVPIDSFRAPQWQDFYNHLVSMIQQEKYSTRYAEHIRKGAIAFFQHLEDTEIIDRAPRNMKKTKIAVVQSKPLAFTQDELDLILNGSGSERTRLFCLLMLNCGYYPGDISDLEQDEIDWKEGRICRKRSKTKKHNNVPEVDFLLWDETFRLLKKHRSSSKKWALTNENGLPLVRKKINGEVVAEVNNIQKAWERMVVKVKYTGKASIINFRKTGAQKLESSPEYDRAVPFYPGHAPKDLAGQRYAPPTPKNFDAAIRWMGDQFGFKTERK